MPTHTIATLYTAEIDTESCIVFLDIHGFIPVSEVFAKVLKEDPDEIRTRLWHKLNTIIKKSIDRYHPTAIREVGGDAWLLTFSYADDAVKWALDVIHNVKHEFMRIIIGMDWGVPRLTKGGATDQSSIMAFKIVEGARKARTNRILITERVIEHLNDQSLVKRCRSVGDYKVRFLGHTHLYRIHDE